jgi:hypothetical protein
VQIDGGSRIDGSVGIDRDPYPDACPAGRLTLDLDTFAWRALTEESAQLGVSIEELASFSVLYYVADRGSGRIARQLPRAYWRDGGDTAGGSGRSPRIPPADVVALAR